MLFDKTNYKIKLRHKLTIFISRFKCSITPVTKHCGLLASTDGILHIYIRDIYIIPDTGFNDRRTVRNVRHVAFDCIYIKRICSEKTSLKLFQLPGVSVNKRKHRLEDIFYFTYLIKYLIHVLVYNKNLLYFILKLMFFI